jgi:hypothetical protein
MTRGNVEFCVVYDGRRPFALLALEDIQRAAGMNFNQLLHQTARTPPTILLSENITPSGLPIESAEPFAKRLIDLGARGAIVVRGRHVETVLPSTLLMHFLGPEGGQAMSAASFGGVILPGRIDLPPWNIICGRCGFPNSGTLALVRRRPPKCQNPTPPPHNLVF